MKLTPFLSATLVSALVLSAARAGDAWTPLFNGKDLAGWDTWLGRPEAGQRAATLARLYAESAALPMDKRQQVLDGLDDLAKVLKEPIGLNRDPLKVYTVVKVDGQPAIRISGQVF